ncbi:hypothetical protein ILYODFUR_036489 [Ilyodon furcidens]|uniref:Uncharacterized protein n=1 Tax=Ilyodon furcidens TaxID=33524 RepID=A0ABV0UBC4_9TELE
MSQMVSPSLSPHLNYSLSFSSLAITLSDSRFSLFLILLSVPPFALYSSGTLQFPVPSPSCPPPPARLHQLLYSSSLLSSAPYCSINLYGRRSISARWLLFFPPFSAPLLSLSSSSPFLQQDPGLLTASITVLLPALHQLF